VIQTAAQRDEIGNETGMKRERNGNETGTKRIKTGNEPAAQRIHGSRVSYRKREQHSKWLPPFFYLFVGMVGRSSRSPALLYPSDHGTKIQQKNDKKNIFIFFIIIFIIIFVA